jgi:hypothetical protein
MAMATGDSCGLVGVFSTEGAIFTFGDLQATMYNKNTKLIFLRSGSIACNFKL